MSTPSPPAYSPPGACSSSAAFKSHRHINHDDDDEDEDVIAYPDSVSARLNGGDCDRDHVEAGGLAGNLSASGASLAQNRARKASAANPLVRLMLRLTKKQEVEKKKEISLDMLQPSRYKPNDLQQMAEDTKFSKREVRRLYRAFKQECPNGIVDEETFKEVYDKIFPLGDATSYAHLVFSAIDRERTGGITFGDFMEFLSVISKGTTEDKLLWTFSFYDVNHDGVISKEEMIKVTDAIHCLMGTPTSAIGALSATTSGSAAGAGAGAGAASSSGSGSSGSGSAPAFDTRAHVDRIFERMDLNKDGMITVDEFVLYCTSQQRVRENMEVLP